MGGPAGESQLDFATGDQFGDYRIEAPLGEGGMGHVYRATRLSDGMEVALKLLKSSMSLDPQHARRFIREARAAQEVVNRHLVEVLDAGEAEGRRYLAMRYIAGRTLEDRIKESGPLPLDEVVAVATDVASGLDALHKAGLIHRDVKSSNILLDDERGALLTDFGLAKRSDYSAVTMPGQLVGTLAYLAPELLRGDEPGPPSDIYGLGCVVFECLAGQPPFAGKSSFEMAFAHLDEPPPDPRADRDDLPEAVSEFALQALEKDPARRPPTATAYARMLLVAARSGSG